MENNYYRMTDISNKVVRRDYSKIKTNFVGPNLLDTQIKSYERFLKNELDSIIKSISPIHSPQDKYTLYVRDIFLGKPKKTEEEAREDAKTYDVPLYADFVIVNNETGEEIKAKKVAKTNENGIFMANIPIMTEKGTFIINGIEKFVIAQISRSPGMYTLIKSQVKLNSSRKKIIEGSLCEILPFKGTLLIVHPNDAKDCVSIVARDTSGESASTFTAVEFLKAFGLTANEIQRIYSNDALIIKNLNSCIYQPSNIFEIKELADLKKQILADLSAGYEKEEIVESLFHSHRLEHKLKKLVFDYILIENEIENGNSSQELINNKNHLMNQIISEKAAKDIVKKMSISLKVFDNNNIPIENDKINYQTLLWQHFCNKRYYDTSEAGRYKLNSKLRLSERLYQKTIAQDIKDTSGKVVFEKGTFFDKANIDKFKQLSKDNKLDIIKKVNINFEPSKKIFDDVILDYEEVKIYLSSDDLDDKMTVNLIGVNTNNKVTQLTLPDLLATISYAANLNNDIGNYDDIDHLGNKRLKLIHELLKSKLNGAMLRIEKYIKEKLAIIDGSITNNQDQLDEEEVAQQNEEVKNLSIRQIVNTKPFQLVIKDFFNSHQLTQFIDQQNPLSELTNKRRISAMGPGGISREDPNLDIRDVHYSHYGRICPIETPEGMNIGLVMSLASFTVVDDRGFLLTPYRKVNNGVITDDIVWLTPSQDDEYIISESNVKVDDKNKIIQPTVVARFKGTSDVFDPKEVDYIDILPRQVVSIAASSIPFLENNDANRALMGSNMQRQATPLIKPYAPIVGTGSEYKIAHDSGMAVVAKKDGVITEVDGKHVKIKYDDGEEAKIKLTKFRKTNQDTCNNQTPIVNVGDKIKASETICDGPAMKNGELALGQNVLVGFTTWSGYNYEDAIILSERLVKDDTYTSISIDEYTVKCLVTKNGDEEITRDIPNVSESAKKYLNSEGIIMVGAEVKEGDILVGKITPKGHVDLSPEEKILQAIFGEKTKPIKDSSLRVPYSGEGVVAAVKTFRIDDDSDLGDDVIQIVKVYVVQKRKIQIGDKMAGRHGNKGIVSKIVPVEDMPFLEDGTPLDVMLNPLGVPSRMNIGQILEIHLGLSAREIAKKELLNVVINKDVNELIKLFSLQENYAKRLYDDVKKLLKEEKVNSYEEAIKTIKSVDIEIILRKLGLSLDDISYKVSTPVFAGCTLEDLEKTMDEAGIDAKKTQGKFKLIDGRTGQYFDGPISVGIMYMLKLDHMVDDKIHARSVGPYSKITQQPLGGKSQNGGQRFGEMEVWALEAYGAAHNLREILTIKSDDVKGRNRTYNAIIKGKQIPSGHMPESFKLLIKQLQGLALATSVIDSAGNEEDTDNYIKYENLILNSSSQDDYNEELNQYDVDKEDLGFSRPVEDFDDEM